MGGERARADQAADRGRADQAAANRARGAAGEALVARWYEQRGYRVLARNWRGPGGELDLVVWSGSGSGSGSGSVVTVCEVKTRTSARFGDGLEAVGAAKQRRIRRLAAAWLAANRPFSEPLDVRFDVASVTDGRIEVVENAF